MTASTKICGALGDKISGLNSRSRKNGFYLWEKEYCSHEKNGTGEVFNRYMIYFDSTTYKNLYCNLGILYSRMSIVYRKLVRCSF